ncbi:hypothetical protein ES332_D13G131700v1 [Gossypium tomentosum]|uniref:Uncharacterized protein n=1 Tax=Gossypium tomentosum TaxID=34277 RepID=A0A5D2HW44_GOSTO|nr:hypothetical protein ES332_D13G131700v1 [Gossypium tomentosum]
MVKAVLFLPSCSSWFLPVHKAYKAQQKILQRQSRNTCSTISISLAHLEHFGIPINLL